MHWVCWEAGAEGVVRRLGVGGSAEEAGGEFEG